MWLVQYKQLLYKRQKVATEILLKVVLNITITPKVRSNLRCSDEVYSIQHYVIKFDSDLRQVSGYLQVLRFPPPIKLTVTK
jgi:hypothetical protein